MADELELLDADELAKSINGFEQIAIRERFREKLETLTEDGTMFMRSLLFVVEKRDGKKDSDAYSAVMTMPLQEVVEKFKGEDDLDEEDESAVAERDRQYADFVVGVGLSFTVEQYMNLTVGQRGALLDAAVRLRG